MPAQPPVWQYWDEEGGARTFQGREITRSTIPFKTEQFSTSHREDYPPQPVWWKHKEPSTKAHKVAEFNHTSTYRDQFKEWTVTRSMPRPRGVESKYDPKLSVATTSRVDFPVHPLPPKKNNNPERKYQFRDMPLGTTTMRADYQLWSLPKPHSRPGLPEPKEMPFKCSTTTREDYKTPAELPPPPAARTRKPHVVPEFEGTTEYRAKYEQVPLPQGMVGAIGLQIASRPYKRGGIGGQFEAMIRQGAPAPQQNTKTFTTAADNQQSAAIVLVCKREDRPDGIVLGYFSLEGLKKAEAGIPKIEVTLKLKTEKTLEASATYMQGGKKKALTFSSAATGDAASSLPLRAVTGPDRVPAGY